MMYIQQEPWRVNYDESQVPPFTLPEVLRSVDGKRISTAAEWESNREPLLELFRKEMYGRRMPRPHKTRYTLLSEKSGALDGLALMRQIEMTFSMENGREHKAVMLLFIPADAGKAVPVFTGLTFNGNHVVCDDPDILVTGTAGEAFRSFDRTPGAQSRRFPLKQLMERSFAVAVCSYHDFFPDDHRGWEESIFSLFFSPEELRPRGRDISAIGAWAWGISRMLDYLETDPLIAADKAAVFGHSRLGKAALWAGAEDTRFKLVCVNDSGCGGAAPSRRLWGETLYSMHRKEESFGNYWFTHTVKDICKTPEKLSVDQHQLISLIAPRSIAVHSATRDRWADPRGEYLSLWHAGPVYELYGKKSLTGATPPPPDTPVGSDMSYFLREGSHDLLLSDWECYMDAFERTLK